MDINGVPLPEGEELIQAVRKAGGQRAFTRKHQLSRTSLQRRLNRAHKESFKHRPVQVPVKEPIVGIRRFILTSAQDSTKIHEGFLDQLEAYQSWLSKDGPCEIMIAGFTYNKSLFSDHSKSKPIWPERIAPMMRWERIRLGDQIDFCAEMNTRPTAENPLSGFETYTRHRWGIFPHSKVQLKSIATMKNEPAKIIMTTGSITLPNYVPLRVGIKAQFHHVIGAVLVEIDEDGTFFCRHLIAEEDGSFYDLDRHVKEGVVTEGHRVEAINWGDLHVAQLCPPAYRAAFGMDVVSRSGSRNGRDFISSHSGSMLETLKPRFQFLHDVSDFQARNHHNLRDPHLQFELFHGGVDSVETELNEVGRFIQAIDREWCQTVVVESNHDLALRRWLKEADYRYDPLNAVFFLRCQLAYYQAIERGDRSFSIFSHVLNDFPGLDLSRVQFLQTDESFKILDIEKGMHGHAGPNGARGSSNGFARSGSKATIGHSHSAEIKDGIYVAGVMGLLDMGYNIGPSSWSQSNVITHPNGKRQMITLCNGRWKL